MYVKKVKTNLTAQNNVDYLNKNIYSKVVNIKKY